MRILIATRLQRHDIEEERAYLALGYLQGKGYEADLDDFLDWSNREEETHEEKYARMLEPYDGLLVIEDEDGRVGRGQYTLVMLAFSAQKHVWVWREGRGVPVRYARTRNEDNWAKGYGELIP